MLLMDPTPSLCPDKADRHQDLAQELTCRPERFISGTEEKKKPSCFIIKREGGNDGRQIAFFVGGKRDTMRGR